MSGNNAWLMSGNNAWLMSGNNAWLDSPHCHGHHLRTQLHPPSRVMGAASLARWHNCLVTQNQSVDQRIADELGVAVRQVSAAVELLDGGSTVPFIARYRKEVTGALDDAQLRTLEERLRYLRELDERRNAILKEIAAQGKLTDELEAQIRAADSKARLEDLYLPYKPKRRTKAQIAREAGLEPLADLLLHDPSNDPQHAAANFVDPDRDVPDAGAALDGARAILRSEEHTSELQSRRDLVCRLLLEK